MVMWFSFLRGADRFRGAQARVAVGPQVRRPGRPPGRPQSPRSRRIRPQAGGVGRRCGARADTPDQHRRVRGRLRRQRCRGGPGGEQHRRNGARAQVGEQFRRCRRGDRGVGIDPIDAVAAFPQPVGERRRTDRRRRQQHGRVLRRRFRPRRKQVGRAAATGRYQVDHQPGGPHGCGRRRPDSGYPGRARDPKPIATTSSDDGADGVRRGESNPVVAAVGQRRDRLVQRSRIGRWLDRDQRDGQRDRTGVGQQPQQGGVAALGPRHYHPPATQRPGHRADPSSSAAPRPSRSPASRSPSPRRHPADLGPCLATPSHRPPR